MSDDTKFQVLRFLVSLAHLDGTISPEEKKIIAKHLKWSQLTEEQRSSLSFEITSPLNPIDVFESLNNERTQRICLDAGRVLINACKNDSEEKILLDQLTKKHMSEIDLPKAYSDVHETMRSAKKLQDLRAENRELTRSRSIWRTLTLINWL